MKAVILAAGRGVRMMPLTQNTPKPLLKVAGRALIDYTMDLLPKEISEVIVVVNYLGQQIVDHLTRNYPQYKFHFVWQEAVTGTFKAVELAKPYLGDDKFLVLFADDIHSKAAVALCAKQDLAILVSEIDERPERFGIIWVKKGTGANDGVLGEIEKFVEKPEKPDSNLANVGVCVLDNRIFKYAAPAHSNGEQYLTDAVAAMLNDYKVMAVETDLWIPIGYPDDLKKAEIALESRN